MSLHEWTGGGATKTKSGVYVYSFSLYSKYLAKPKSVVIIFECYNVILFVTDKM